MSYKIVRHSANNQSPIMINDVVQSNLVDFSIDPQGIANLKKSYIAMKLSVIDDTRSGAQVPISRTVCSMLECGNAFYSPSSVVSLVRNAYLEFSMKGKVEDVRRVGLIKNVVASYTRSYDTLSNDPQSPFAKVECISENLGIIPDKFRQLTKLGNTPSQRKEFEIQITLGELFDSCSLLQGVDLNQLGTMNIHLELDLGKIRTYQVLGATGQQSFANFWNVPAGVNPRAENGAMNQVLNTANAVRSLTTTREYKNLDDSPFYVGQRLRALGDLAGVGDTDVTANIVSIAYKGGVAGGRPHQLTLTFDADIIAAGGMGGGNNLDNTIVRGADVGGAGQPLTIDRPELVLRLENKGAVNVAEGVEYTTYSIEEDLMNGNPNFSKIYQIEPECSNVLVAFDPNDNDPFATVSNTTRISDYRFRVNNMDITDEVVRLGLNGVSGGSIHYDLLKTTFNNMGRQVNDLMELPTTGFGMGFTQTNNAQQDVVRNRVLGIPLPLTNEPKLLNVQVTISGAAANNNRIILIKQLNKKM